MQIRKNTRAFKTISEIISACENRPDREKLIRLYITKGGQSIKNRISVEGIQSDEVSMFYEMNYQAILYNLKSSNHQLHQSDDVTGIYFFHSISNKVWDETPFEFDEAIQKQFHTLTDLPVFRKKEKADKFVFPTKAKRASMPVKKEKAEINKPIKFIHKRPKQPNYKLKHKIIFTDLDRIIFKQPRLSKKDVLDYYNQIAQYLLPYLKDRPQIILAHSDGSRKIQYSTLEDLTKNNIELPDWIQRSFINKSQQEHMLFCNDREHLLFYASIGCLQFNPSAARTKTTEFPDYIIIGIESPDATLEKCVDVALTAKMILSALQLPAFVKTDGISGLHIYIPLDTKSKYETTMKVAAYICKLIRLKVPDLVTLKGVDNYTYGKVSLDYQINENIAAAPYSLVVGDSATIATPLLWDEVTNSLRVKEFNHETIFEKLKQVGDPFNGLFKKKVNADTLLEKIETNYSFLFEN